ncbi:hypothetical protein Ari01nite_26380 [Paractinoplanes rishiriensis]|uniref:Uncharacterized protein n=1 Tax=Paractinoplanes rishiriensis TaxID=1050105 RepID=A0A919JUS5_9ACTN|nr:hypothetical protein Ari01nite_26380 [Actinoplanes rishiriensis]
MLDRATGDLSVRPDLLDRVRAGGRRRVIRRRAVLAGGLAVLAAGAAVPLSARGRSGNDLETAGDLAGDPQFRARVRAAWATAMLGFATEGEPLIRWAGRTPAGPVAVVQQASPVAGGTLWAEGFVHAGRGLGPVHLSRWREGSPMAVLLGPRRDVLVVWDAGNTVSLSAGHTVDAAGKVRRDWERIGPVHGGVLVRTVAPQAGDVRLGLREDGNWDESVPLANYEEVVPASQENRTPTRVERWLPGRDRAWPADLTQAELDTWDLSFRPDYNDNLGFHPFTGHFRWIVRGAAPDGRRLVVQILELGDRRRVFWMIGTPDRPHYAGELDDRYATGLPRQTTLVHIRLPEQIGVLVSAPAATLRYRAGAGPWLPVNGDTALLPAAASRVEVTPRGGNPVPVALV